MNNVGINNSQQNVQPQNNQAGIDNSTMMLPYMAVGAGTALGIGKGVDLFCSSGKGYEKSPLGKIVGKIDKWAANNKFAQSIEKTYSSIQKGISNQIKNFTKKSEVNKEIADSFKKGTKTKSMLVRKSIERELKEQLAKNPQDVLAKNKLSILKNSNSLFAKLASKLTLGTGSFMGGGMGNALLMGVLLGNTFKTAMDAPPGEKLSTFMEDLMGGWIGGYLLMSPAGKLVNGISGMKNLVVKPNSPMWKKALQTVGKVVGYGQGKPFLPGLPGGILRLALVIGMTVPFTELFKRISHAIFGKPTHKNDPMENQMNSLLNPNKTNNNQQPQQPNTQNQQGQMNQSGQYLPSTEPVKVSNNQQANQQSGLDKILNKADGIEKQASQTLQK